MILFDLDGTLSDSNDIWEETDRAFLGRRGLAPTEEYSYTMGHSIFPVAAQFTKDYYGLDMTTQEIMDEWTAMARDAYRQVPLKPGAAEFLAQCHARGERMAMLTACVPDLCRSVLDHYSLNPYFEQVIFAMELNMEKRDGEIYRHTAKLLGVAPEACVFYEDAPANCVAAKAVGLTVVGVYDDFYHKYEPEMRQTCDRYIRSFEELLA